MTRFRAFVLAVVIGATALMFAALNNRAVMLSAYDGDDVCGGIGSIKAATGKSVALSNRPSMLSVSVSTLRSGDKVILCEAVDGWYGVLVPAAGAKCIDHEATGGSAAYSGNCKSGWVPAEAVELLAG